MRVLVFVTAWIAVLALARPSHACGSGTGELMAKAFGTLIAYGGPTMTFTVVDIQDPQRGTAYGVAEVAFNAPATVLMTALVIDDLTSDDPSRNHEVAKAAGVLAVWNGALLAHGVYTLARRRRREVPRTAIAPLPTRDGAGLGLSGTF